VARAARRAAGPLSVRTVCLVALTAGGRSGIPRYAAVLASSIDRVAGEFPGLEVRLLTSTTGAENVAATNIGVEVARGRLGRLSAGPGRVLADQLLSATRREDVLHFFDLTGPLLRPTRRFVATVHDAALRHGFERARTAHKRVLQPYAIRRARALVAVSEFARDEAVQRFGATAHRVRVVRSGPGLTAGSDADDGDGTDGPYLLYVGNLAEHKNLPFLVRAFARVDTGARLKLVGVRGDRNERVRTAVDASPARDRIELVRDAEDGDVDRLYRGAAALVHPSRYEGFGFTPLEAMARGCPVLASDIPALREISGDGALLLPLDDEAAWADAMTRVLADDGFRSELRGRGAATVSRYSWDETARGVLRVLEAVT
jgi:glycosyltransferase involved in cell wall biosynthesis